MKTYTLCGSMRFAQQMRRIAYELETQNGWNILQCVYDPPGGAPDGAALDRLVRAHLCKIDLSDGIYVVNPGGYVGQAVRREIAYAQAAHKEVLYLCPPAT